MAQPTCQVGGFLSRCHNEADHVCQYCGRPFCRQHSHYVHEYEAVCSRKRCAQKRDDLAEHLHYRERVTQRNHAGLCGVEECDARTNFECSLCLGLFCPSHLSEHMYPFKQGVATVDRPVSVCGRCWSRRKIWRSA